MRKSAKNRGAGNAGRQTLPNASAVLDRIENVRNDLAKQGYDLHVGFSLQVMPSIAAAGGSLLAPATNQPTTRKRSRKAQPATA
jgi:hypothetical protein